MFPYCTCQQHARQGQDIDRFDQIRSRLAFEQVHENGMRQPHLIYTVIEVCVTIKKYVVYDALLNLS